MNETTRSYLKSAALLASVLLLASCASVVSKGDVYQAVSRNIQIGANRSEVEKYLRSLEVKGVEAAVSDYLPNTSRQDVVAPNGKGVIFEGTVVASFSNGVGGSVLGCGSVFAIFCFDEDGKLITYQIDCSR
jgi:hypothetical protein